MSADTSDAGGFSLEEWQIRLVLPHRPPVLQLDRVPRCAPALDALEACKALGGGDAMVTRWAAGPALLAPTALIEAMAQSCGLLLRLRWLAGQGADLCGFASGDADALRGHDIPRSALADSNVRFAAPASPGRMLHLATRLVMSRGDMHRFDASVRSGLDQAVLATAQIMLNFPTAA